MGYALQNFQCDQPACGCPPGHFCWHCLKDVQADKLAWLLLNHPDLVDTLNQVRMGVIDGSPALPGQVGEFISGQATIAIPALGAGITWGGTAQPLQIPPGDWMVFADAYWDLWYPSVAFGMTPPSGFSSGMLGGSWGTGDPNNRVAVGQACHALISNPVHLVFNVAVAAAGATGAGTYTQRVQAYRIR